MPGAVSRSGSTIRRGIETISGDSGVIAAGSGSRRIRTTPECVPRFARDSTRSDSNPPSVPFLRLIVCSPQEAGPGGFEPRRDGPGRSRRSLPGCVSPGSNPVDVFLAQTPRFPRRIAPGKWVQADSNHRSRPCKGRVIPRLDHGPAVGKSGPREIILAFSRHRRIPTGRAWWGSVGPGSGTLRPPAARIRPCSAIGPWWC